MGWARAGGAEQRVLYDGTIKRVAYVLHAFLQDHSLFAEALA
jgi:hypothetical protein